MSWITESNRWKHFKYAILCGFVGTFLFALGVAMDSLQLNFKVKKE